jgi:hypothetical protein
MDEEFILAMKKYYKLKEKYEITLQKQKQKIMDTELSKKEKQARFKRLKIKCINCKKDGGTIFTNKNSTLKAVCGSEEPCNLNIELFKSNCIDKQEELRLYADDLNKYKTSIIMTKLDFLFGYSSEAETLTLFEETRLDIGRITDKMFQLERDINNITNNKETQDTILLLTKVLYDDQSTLKQMYKKDKKGEVFKDMVELYCTKIKPQTKLIRELNYVYTGIDYNEDDDTYKLIELPFTRDKMEMFDKKSVIVNKGT